MSLDITRIVNCKNIFVLEPLHGNSYRNAKLFILQLGSNQYKMILTTTPNIEGRRIEQYLGVVTSQTIIGANFFKDILAGLRDIFGGRSGAYERILDEAKQFAMGELVQRAKIMGADAIVGIDLDYETVGSKGSMLMVSVSGTAVKLQ
jgi:uncharacterized protein YbjQ (UPF0145 family)